MDASNRQIIGTLFAKDLRLFRTQISSLIGIGAMCYAVAVGVCLDRGSTHGGDPRFTMGALFLASTVANGLTSLLASVFGGMSIAGERRDRTCDFIALLPVTRKQILLSKRLAGASALMTCAVANGAITLLIGICAVWRNVPIGDLGASVAQWIACTSSFYGLSWLLSTMIQSGAISACVGIALTAACWIVTAASVAAVELLAFSVTLPDEANWDNSGHAPLSFIIISMVFGLCGLIAGDIYYSRRVAP